MKIYLYDIRRPFTPDELGCIPGVRIRGAKRFLHEEDAARHLAAGLLARRFLPKDYPLLTGECGKPYFEGRPLYFNLSHAGSYVALAVAGNEVGVDIEPVCPYDEAVAKKCFTPRERGWLREQGGDEAFYTLWTAKESVMKATGKGFTLPPEHFCVLPMDGSAHIIDGRTWYFTWLHKDRHVLCAATENERERADVICYR